MSQLDDIKKGLQKSEVMTVAYIEELEKENDDLKDYSSFLEWLLVDDGAYDEGVFKNIYKMNIENDYTPWRT